MFMAGPSRSLTSGGIFYSLARFSLPVLLTLFLQALYGLCSTAKVNQKLLESFFNSSG